MPGCGEMGSRVGEGPATGRRRGAKGRGSACAGYPNPNGLHSPSCGNDFVCSLQCILYRFFKHPCNPHHSTHRAPTPSTHHTPASLAWFALVWAGLVTARTPPPNPQEPPSQRDLSLLDALMSLPPGGLAGLRTLWLPNWAMPIKQLLQWQQMLQVGARAGWGRVQGCGGAGAGVGGGGVGCWGVGCWGGRREAWR